MGAVLQKHEHNLEPLSRASQAGAHLVDEATRSFKPKSLSEQPNAGAASDKLVFDHIDIYGVGVRAKALNPAERVDKPSSTEAATSVSDSDKVKRIARTSMTDGDYKSFVQDMQKFEQRADKIGSMYEKQGVPVEQARQRAHDQINKTYDQVGALLEAKDNPSVPIDAAGRSRLAREIIKNAADPTEIRQGAHKTCTVATIESRLYTRQPALAARVVVDMATTGRYVAADGTKVSLDQQSLKPDQDAAQKDSIFNRSYASQLFQVTAVNLSYAKTQPNIHYEQHKVDPNLAGDYGERQVDYSSGKPKERTPGWFDKHFNGVSDDEFHRPYLYLDQLLAINSAITGTKETNWMMQYVSMPSAGVISPKSAKDLEESVLRAKASGNLPMTVSVHTGNEPFYSDSGAGAAGGSGGLHVVSITDIEPGKPAKLSVDNQWDKDADHLGDNKLTASEIFRAMKTPGDGSSMKELAEEVSANRKSGKIDDFKEFDLLRLKKLIGTISAADYNQAFLAHLRESQTRWHKAMGAGIKDKDALDIMSKTSSRQSETILLLPPDKMVEALKIQQDAGYASPDYVNKMLGRFVATIRTDFQRDTANPSQLMSVAKAQSYSEATHRMVEMIDAMPLERRESVRKYARDFGAKSKAAP